MAKIYYDLIKTGLKELRNVPQKWFAEVEALLTSE